jgi:hypothetical protein
VAFQRRAGAVGDHRHAVSIAQGENVGDLGGRFGEHHAVGRQRRVGRFVLAVMQAHRLGR